MERKTLNRQTTTQRIVGWEQRIVESTLIGKHPPIHDRETQTDRRTDRQVHRTNSNMALFSITHTLHPHSLLLLPLSFTLLTKRVFVLHSRSMDPLQMWFPLVSCFPLSFFFFVSFLLPLSLPFLLFFSLLLPSNHSCTLHVYVVGHGWMSRGNANCTPKDFRQQIRALLPESGNRKKKRRMAIFCYN